MYYILQNHVTFLIVYIILIKVILNTKMYFLPIIHVKERSFSKYVYNKKF